MRFWIPALFLLLPAAAVTTRAPQEEAIHRLADGTLLEGRLERSRQGLRLVTPFGERAVAPDDYDGRTDASLSGLADRYRELVANSAPRARDEQKAVAEWCRRSGFLTGYRRQLNRLLAMEVDDPWARDRVASLAGTYVVHRSERGRRGRDERDFIDFLFERLARRDNVGAVMAVHKAVERRGDLTYRAAMRMLGKGRPRQRWAAAKVLAGHTDRPGRISPLYKLGLQDGLWAVRREAVRALAATEDPTFAKLYAKELRNPEAMIRVRAAQALAELGMEEAVLPLVAALQDTTRPVRNFVAVTRQTAYVKDYDVEVAQTAFIADPVVDVIQDGAVLETAVVSIGVERRLYRDALRRLTGADLGLHAAEWRRWLEQKRQ